MLRKGDVTVMYTGDIMVRGQLTVPPMSLPADVIPDVLMIESTYAYRKHPDRQSEEEELIALVNEVLRREGTVLVSSFAIGRAQEIVAYCSDT